MRGTLLLVAAQALAPAIVFACIGGSLSRRAVSDENRGGRNAYVAWWVGLGIASASEAAQTAIGSFGIEDAVVHLALLHLLLIGLSVAAWGLVDYVLHIYGAPWGIRIAFTGYQGFGYLLMHQALDAAGLERVQIETWRVDAVVGSLPGVLASVLIGAFCVLPVVASLVAYAMLFPHAPSPLHRFRIVVMSTGFAVWLASLAILDSGFAPGSHPVAALEELPSIAFAGFAALAHFPPRALARRLGIEEAVAGVNPPAS